jgi:formylglycine-generating enzyme required for sulfatase activity
LWGAACVAAGPKNGPSGRFTNRIGMEFILVKPGTLTVRDRQKGGTRVVAIETPYYLGTHEVTQEQWTRLMGNNPSRFVGDDHPVERVSWRECVAFCRTLSAFDGRTYRLPTALEWEYACRAGSKGDFCFGGDEKKLGEYAWYAANSGEGVDDKGHAIDGHTQPVGRKKPNAWGYFDMRGNVMEWCQDEMTPPENAIAHRNALHDTRGTPLPDSWRVVGGGCYAFAAFMSWCDGRWQPYPDLDCAPTIGFRVVLEPPEEPGQATSSLRAKYEALSWGERRKLVKELTADQLDRLIRETVAAFAKGRTPADLRENWDQLAMLTGDWFEQWGEKLLAGNRRLTRARILGLLRDGEQSFAWRVAFHGYLRVALRNAESRDVHEIGLTQDEAAKLREEIPKLRIAILGEKPQATR